MFEAYGDGEPVRLLVGGLHGNEGTVTEPLLRNVSIEVNKGTLVICNLSRTGRYLSTLDPKYYQTRLGKKLLSLITRYQPEIYIELHSYGEKAHSNLTRPDRIVRIGVPSLVELEKGILIGSVSPYLRRSVLNRNSLCLTLEIPSYLEDKSTVIRILNKAVTLMEKAQFLNELRKTYPRKLKIAEEKFHEYFKELEPF